MKVFFSATAINKKCYIQRNLKHQLLHPLLAAVAHSTVLWATDRG
ncbi:hypothetical protein [Levilactobacillus yiduensis]|nr:hypothetical protein [Levilactobacillus yiduensis]